MLLFLWIICIYHGINSNLVEITLHLVESPIEENFDLNFVMLLLYDLGLLSI